MSIYRAIKDRLYNGLVFVMQLCLFAIATQVCTCYMNNQLLQKEKCQPSHTSKAFSLSDENI